MKRQILACSVAIVTTVAVAACSTPDDPSASSTPPAVTTTSVSMDSATAQPGTHNDADIAFNQNMIPHHTQALMMSDLVAARTTTPAVRDLAARISAAQKPEIDEMTARLDDWGVTASAGHMAGGHMSGTDSDHDMSGMMTPAEMTALSGARGAEFDRLWLEGMIRHHQGAVEMADEELASGIDGPSRELAERIKAAQQAEIDEMNQIMRR